ncbi:MAG: hypothetical protein ACOYL6_10065 [Bacteriovoracaceae bacterium]
MRSTFVRWYKFLINQFVLTAFVLSSILPAAGFAQSPSPTAAPMTSGSNGYVASEKFMNDKAAEEEGYQQGVVEMITTVVMTLVLGVAPIPKRYGPSKNDCKQNNFGIATVLMAKAAAITYIITEIYSHYKFKKAGEAIKEISIESVADAGGEEQGTAKEKDKQLTSFNRLIALYRNEDELLKSKLVAQGIMTSIFAAALGVEIAGMVSCAGTCSANYTANLTAATAALSSIAGLNSAILTAACGGVQAVALCTGCTAYVVKSSAKAVEDGATLAKIAAKGVKSSLLGSKNAAKGVKDAQEFLKGINIVNSVNASTTASSATDMFKDLNTEQKDSLIADANATLKKGNETKEDIDNETTSALSNSCPLSMASMKAHTTYNKMVKANIQCCGTEIGTGSPNLLTPDIPVPPGLAYMRRDLKEPKDTETKLKKFLAKMKKMFSFGKQASSVVPPKDGAFINNKDASALAAQTEFYVQLEKELNRTKGKKLTMKDHWKFQKFVHNFFSKENLKKFDPLLKQARADKDPYVTKLVTLLDALLIPQAQAGVVGDVIESPILKVMMMTGTGAMLFKKTIQKFYDKWAQKAPINRSVFWGLLTGLALTVTLKTKKMQVNLDDRAATVEAEKKKFIEATGLKEEVKDNHANIDAKNKADPKSGGKKGSTKTTDIDEPQSCFTDEGADPSCECKKAGSCLKFDDHDISSLNLPAIFSDTMRAGNKMANNMSEGNLSGANVAAGQFGKDGLGNYNALQRKNKELENQLNQMRKSTNQEPIDFEGMTNDLTKSFAALTNNTLAKDLGGGTMGPLASTGPNSLDKESHTPTTTSSHGGTPMTLPQAPAVPSGSLMDDEGLLAEELPKEDSMTADEQTAALNQYELNNNDIVKSDESIFKILSSRYLRTAYPKLLKLEDTPPPAKNAPATPADADAPK